MYISLLLLLITCMHQCCPIFLTPRPKIEIVLLAADRTSELQSSDQELLNIINCMHCGTLWVVTTLNSLSLTRRWNWMFGSHCQTLRHAVPVRLLHFSTNCKIHRFGGPLKVGGRG